MTHATVNATVTRMPNRKERAAAAMWAQTANRQESNRAEAERIVLRITDRSVAAAEEELTRLRRTYSSDHDMRLALSGAFSSVAEICEGEMKRFMEKASKAILGA